MPKRNRTNEQRKHGVRSPAATAAPSAPSAPSDEVSRAAALFAASVKAHEDADRAEQQRRRELAERSNLHQSLRDAKQAAADQIKRLRASGASRQRLDEADAVYRAALADLQEHETGERPHWAPAVVAPEPEPDTEPEADQASA